MKLVRDENDELVLYDFYHMFVNDVDECQFDRIVHSYHI
jgi:hypothetical protein